MCLVSYVPTGKSTFILSSNRDESPIRQVTEIQREFIKGEEVIFPVEIKGGSWIFASSFGQVICLLNGGFIKHKHSPPYEKSRGLIMKDFFQYDNAIDFFALVDLYNIEPFTMVICETNRIFELVWDGLAKHVKELDSTEKHVWSSSMLYPPEIQKLRKNWFFEWFAKIPEHDLENINSVHRNGGEPDPTNGFIMNRDNRVATISITHIVKSKFSIKMIYEDFLRKESMESDLKINQLLA